MMMMMMMISTLMMMATLHDEDVNDNDDGYDAPADKYEDHYHDTDDNDENNKIKKTKIKKSSTRKLCSDTQQYGISNNLTIKTNQDCYVRMRPRVVIWRLRLSSSELSVASTHCRTNPILSNAL
jgi:hypothetical protein